MNKLSLLILIIFLTSCQNNILKNIAKTDIDIITEIHAANAKDYLEDLVIKLYKLNPVYIKGPLAFPFPS